MVVVNGDEGEGVGEGVLQAVGGNVPFWESGSMVAAASA